MMETSTVSMSTICKLAMVSNLEKVANFFVVHYSSNIATVTNFLTIPKLIMLPNRATVTDFGNLCLLGGGGVYSVEIWVEVCVRPAAGNPYPISDQNL